MDTVPEPGKPWYRRLRLGMSVRWLIGLILLVSLGLGWWDHLARQQRNAVRAIEAAGGKVNYQWVLSGAPSSPKTSQSSWSWLVKTLGTDRVCNVNSVAFLAHRHLNPEPSINDALMIEVSKLRHLQTLQVGTRNEVTSKGLAEFGRLKRLTELHLVLTEREHFDLSFLANLRSLEALSLSQLALVNDDLKHFEGLTKLQILTVFPTKTDGPSITDAGLADLAGLTELKQLRLNNARIIGPGLANLSRMTQLQGLWIMNTPVDSLKSLPALPLLKTLFMNDTSLTDAGLSGIDRFPNLAYVFLERTPIGDAGLAQLSRLKRLETLDLSKTKVTDAGLAHLAGHPMLGELWLRSTDISDAGANSLATCPRLKRMYLQGTNLSNVGVANLAAMPGMTIFDTVRTPVAD